MTPLDYSQYTMEELLQAESTIVPSMAPENFAALKKELALRRRQPRRDRPQSAAPARLDTRVFDYSNFTTAELQQVAATIVPELAPENYENLQRELARRADSKTQNQTLPTTAHSPPLQEQQEDTAAATDRRITFSRLKLLGAFQIATAVALVIYLAIMLRNGSDGLSIAVVASAAALNAPAGWLLIKHRVAGFRLSLVNQALQLFSFSIGGVAFNYSGIGGIYIGITDAGVVSLTARVWPGLLVFGQSSITLPAFLELDLLAVFFIGVLLTGLRLVKPA